MTIYDITSILDKYFIEELKMDSQSCDSQPGEQERVYIDDNTKFHFHLGSIAAQIYIQITLVNNTILNSANWGFSTNPFQPNDIISDVKMSYRRMASHQSSIFDIDRLDKWVLNKTIELRNDKINTITND